MKRFTLSLLLIVASGGVIADECEHRRSLDFGVDGAGVQTLEITAGASGLVVRGGAGGDRIEVRATACASSERLLEALTVNQRRSGQRLLIETGAPDFAGWSWRAKYAYIDLELHVPERLELEVEDGSGPVEIERVAKVVIEDGSGELTLRDIGGDVAIDDGSGAIRVRTVAGTLRIEDGSGGIDVAGVEGSVIVPEDGSGEIEIRDVIGDVEIEEDGSGAIRIAGVGGSVKIRRDGSGNIDVAEVGGDFEVGRDGGGALNYRDVDGRVAVPPERERVY